MTITAAFSDTLTHNELMDMLRESAEDFRPRMFAIYGILKRVGRMFPEAPFMAWGMDFGDERGAVAWDVEERSSHKASNVSQVLRFYERMGEARLMWLDPEDS